MCTAITYQTKDFYFGRTLDYDFSYREEVTVTPRNFPLNFSNGQTLQNHYAIIGMAHVLDGYPLYYDAANEKGLAIAGLNFTHSTCYGPDRGSHRQIAQFELISFLLAQCATVTEAKTLLVNSRITGKPFQPQLPAARLHWLIADAREAVTVEAVSDGIRIYSNPVGVLTNEPPFDHQLLRLGDYMTLSSSPPENRFAPGIALKPYSRGMGAMGLPGDLSSQSRFVRAAFVKLNSVSGHSEEESVSQFFHILGSVEQQRGCCRLEDGKFEITLYSSCCNATRGIYYYSSYENRQITAVDMHRCDLDSQQLTRFPLLLHQQIRWQN